MIMRRAIETRRIWMIPYNLGNYTTRTLPKGLYCVRCSSFEPRMRSLSLWDGSDAVRRQFGVRTLEEVQLEGEPKWGQAFRAGRYRLEVSGLEASSRSAFFEYARRALDPPSKGRQHVGGQIDVVATIAHLS